MIYSIEIRRLYISSGHDFKGRFGMDPLRHETPSVETVECVAGKGIVGDRYFGYKENFKGQITFIAQETIDAVGSGIGAEQLDSRLLRRNVVTVGVDLNELIGRVFRIGGVLFAGTEECAPCFWMDKVVDEGAMRLLAGRGGLRARILESGTLALGPAEVEIVG